MFFFHRCRSVPCWTLFKAQDLQRFLRSVLLLVLLPLQQQIAPGASVAGAAGERQQQRGKQQKGQQREGLLQQQQQQLFSPSHSRRRLQLHQLLLLLLLLTPDKGTMAAAVGAAAAAAEEGPHRPGIAHRPAPVIGVLTQPVDESLPDDVDGVSRQLLEDGDTSYVAASYVKLIESAGCMAYPIDLNLTEEEHRTLFSQINGLLLPGGSSDISKWSAPYLKTTKLYYEMAKEANSKGHFFPIFAICLGFEALMIAASGNLNYFTEKYDYDLDRRRTLAFQPQADASVIYGNGVYAHHSSGVYREVLSPKKEEGNEKREDMFVLKKKEDEKEEKNLLEENADLATLRKNFSVKEIRNLLEMHPVAYFHHYRHLSKTEFQEDKLLSKDWILLATANLPGKKPIEVVAAVEHKQFPFFGVQYHPEKALFEHCPKSRVPHFFLAIIPTLYTSAFLGLMARRSRNAFKSRTEHFRKVSFAYTPTRTAVYGQFYSFEQTYFFPQSKMTELKQQQQQQQQQRQQQQQDEA